METNVQAYQAAVAEQLTAERAARGLTIDSLAASAGIHRSSVIRYLDGERDIKMSALFAMAGALGLSVPELLLRAEQRIGDQ